tara:strand:- start:5147 stop:5869 length:723 start_codon:yes stop_codon:yes gene_type:complete
VNIQEPLSTKDMENAIAYDTKKEFEDDEIKSEPEIAHFTVIFEELQNNNERIQQERNEFSKKNNAIFYNMGCILEKQTEDIIQPLEEIKKNEITDIKLPMETNKLNSYIALSPKDGKYFPSSFNLKVTNKVDVNKYNYELWGAGPNVEGAPSNGVIDKNIIQSMPYPKDLYSIKNTNMVIGNIDIGNKALNVLSIGSIFDENFKVIGNVDSLNNDIIINCDNAENITGLLIYIGAPVPIQ